MQYGQLTEYNIRKINIFLKIIHKYGQVIPRPFCKKSKLKCHRNVIKFAFIVCPCKGLQN